MSKLEVEKLVKVNSIYEYINTWTEFPSSYYSEVLLALSLKPTSINSENKYITALEAWEIRAARKVLRSALKTQCPQPQTPPKPTTPIKPAFPYQALRSNVLMTKYDLVKLSSEQ